MENSVGKSRKKKWSGDQRVPTLYPTISLRLNASLIAPAPEWSMTRDKLITFSISSSLLFRSSGEMSSDFAALCCTLGNFMSCVLWIRCLPKCFRAKYLLKVYNSKSLDALNSRKLGAIIVKILWLK